MTRIVAISDTHGFHRFAPPIPDGDILIHAGDLTRGGNLSELPDLNAWFGELKPRFKRILATAGNHDWAFEENLKLATMLLTNVEVFVDDYVIIDGLLYYFSPYQPEFCDWAYNLPRGEPLREKWSLIPDNVDVLVTHGPPHGILDVAPFGGNVGCEELRQVIGTRINPKLHVFGHIHDGYGMTKIGNTTFVNAAICTERYQPINAPIVIDI
jgi:Icc-related predicted phosphoesterase